MVKKRMLLQLPKVDIFQPYKSEDDFESTIVDRDVDAKNDVRYDLYVFHIGCQKDFTAAQPIKKSSNLMEWFLLIKVVMLWF